MGFLSHIPLLYYLILAVVSHSCSSPNLSLVDSVLELFNKCSKSFLVSSSPQISFPPFGPIILPSIWLLHSCQHSHLSSLRSEFLMSPICFCSSVFIQAERGVCGNLLDLVSNLTCSAYHPGRVTSHHSPRTLDSPILLSKCSCIFLISVNDSAF